MSQYVTRLPVPLADTLKLLPPGAHLDAIVPRIDLHARTAEMEIVWSHDQLRAPCQSGNEFPREMLKRKQLPAGVKLIKTAEPKTAGTDGSTPGVNALDSQPPETPQ